MTITTVKTHTITAQDTNLIQILDTYLPQIPEGSIVAVTSKIVSICEGRVVPIERVSSVSGVSKVSSGEEQKDRLIEEESEYFLPRALNPYGVSFSIIHGILAASAGIDESNADGKYVLWPENPQESANAIRAHIAKSKGLREIGVIITDSRTMPLRWGVTGFCVAYSGFQPLKDYVGTPDLFGREFVFEKMSITDNLSSAATLVMGEGAEGMPLAVITDVPFVQFQDRNPTAEELADLRIDMDTDLYAPFLKSAPWKKGKRVGK